MAEIYNCNGTWSNKPCPEGGALESIVEIKRAPQTPEEISASQKKMIVHDLQTLKFNAERETGLMFVISDILAICNSQDATLEDCTEKANQKVDSITKSLTDVKISRENNKTKKPEDQQVSDPTTDKNVSITVVENRDPYYKRFPWYRPTRPKPFPTSEPDRPVIQPPVTPEPPVKQPGKQSGGGIGIK